MERRTANVDLEKLELEDLTLIDGEQINTALHLTDDHSDGNSTATNVVLLTDKRVIHLNANGRTREVVFASLQDMDTVEIASERRGYGGFVWGALAFLVALLIWRVWDHPVGSVAVAVVIALMGVYLIVDQWLMAKILKATFNAGSSRLQLGISSAHAFRRDLQLRQPAISTQRRGRRAADKDLLPALG